LECETLAVVGNYFSELISLLAVVVALLAGSRAYKANKLAENLAKELNEEKWFIRRTELIVANEQKIAASKKLTMILGQKLDLVRDHPKLLDLYPNEEIRLLENLSVIKTLNEKEQYSYELLEHESIGKNVSVSKKTLADIVRLRIRMESDFDNESMSLDSMKAGIKNT
jgi:hypothetical protein